MTWWETPVTDPALDFWLRHVAAEGGLYEPADEASYVVLPPALSDRYRLPEELRVTGDPDIARDEGVTLLALGHPVLSDAAARTLVTGDPGYVLLAGPTSMPPSPEVLLAAVRDAVPIDHGRIDLTEAVTAVRHHVLRVGALVTFELSAEDRFQEQAERWVDVQSRRLLPAGIAERLARAATDSGRVPSDTGQLLPAIAAAHRLIDAAALARRETLAGEVNGAHQAERARAVAYYADAITAIERRLATAPADRRAVLEERMRGTREEEARRLAEIAEKYAASHAIRPYRLHVIEVPALRLPTDVRRGDRRYPMTFDWLLPAGAFAPVRCPSCGGEAPLVAGKQKLGCETCLPPRVESVAAPPAKSSVGVKAVQPSAAATAAAKDKTAAAQSPPTSRVPAKVPPKARAAKASPPREPAVPPRAKQREMRRPPEQIAAELWTAVAGGRSENASRLLEPGSPAAALYRVFGPSGLTQAVGLAADVPPYSYTAGRYELGASADLISGILTGMDESTRTYFLSHRSGRIVEVLPCPVYTSGELWHPFWRWDYWDESWTRGRVPRAADLDLVGRTLFAIGPRWHGLAVTARSVAAWERLGDSRQRLLADRSPLAVAAAVDRLVDYRAGGRGAFAAAGEAYRVPEPDLRSADRAIRPLLALGPNRPW
jgi:hypothetical protein